MTAGVVLPMRTPYLLHVHGQFVVTMAWLTSLAVLHTFQRSCICWHVYMPHILQDDSADVAQPCFGEVVVVVAVVVAAAETRVTNDRVSKSDDVCVGYDDERERERERGRVCVCVRERERERERERRQK